MDISIHIKRSMAKKMRDFRYQLGMTQEELAETLSVKQGTISKVEAGRIFPSSRYLMRMREIFAYDINEFFDSMT